MKARIFVFYLLCFLFAIPPGRVAAQEVTFDKVLPPQGKSFDLVTGITQDKQGFIWLASKRGLYKYDGYRMTAYRTNALNPSSIISNSLETVFADRDGTIWIGSLGTGLDHFNPATGVFRHYRFDPQVPTGISNDTVTAILRDRQGQLWIGTHQGLDRFDEKTGRFFHYRHQPNNPQSLSNNQVRAIYEDRSGTLWIGTGSPFADNGGKPDEGGLNRMDKKTGTFTCYLHNPADPNSLANNKVRALYEDSKGNFWVGTAGSDGLHLMDRKTGTFQRFGYDPAHPGRLSRPPIDKAFASWDHITFVCEDATGAIWIGTAAGGINRFDPVTKKLTQVDLFPGEPGDLASKSTWWAFVSKDNVLWISTKNGYLLKTDPFQEKLPHYSLRSATVYAVLQEDDGHFLFGTNKGLVQTDADRRIIMQWVNDPKNSLSLSDNTVLSITEDRPGFYWIGTMEGGLNLFDQQKGTFTRFQHNAGNKTSISGNLVMPALKDKEGRWWFGTNQGVNGFDRLTNTFTAYTFYPVEQALFTYNLVSSILEDRQGNFWVGTWQGGGVHRLTKETGGFKSFLKGVSVSVIYQDSDGVLWVGGSDGLYRYDRRANDFVPFVDPSSFGNIQDVISMIEDNQRNLWVGTPEGLVRINQQRNETNFYGKEYGVAENSLSYKSAYKTKTGELLFGDTSGYFAFFPNQLEKSSRPPEIIFSDFRLADQLVVPGKESLLKVPLSETKELRLRHNQTIFSIDFTAIDYSDPEKNRLLFMLENYDLQWHKAGAERRAYYFNVPPGHYVFRVKASNNKGIWAEKILDIIITPPWWQTWWAYTLLVLFAAGCIWGLLWHRSRKLKKENAVLEQKVTERTQQLNCSLEELKTTQSHLIQREKMASLGELTAGIAHEIQNPLNFVNNFAEVGSDLLEELQEAVEQNDKAAMEQLLPEINANLQKIHYHGNRAGTIVKNMLQLSRKNMNQKEPVDLNTLVDEYLRLSYHGVRAKEKGFSAILETYYDSTINKVIVNSEEIGRVLINLFSNAFYAMNEKRKRLDNDYNPVIQVSTEKKNGKVEIIVRDNGVGISEKIREKIYQPFFTTKPTGEGTGLGLSLSYDIITKGHGGELKVRSKEGEGAEFIVDLPLNESFDVQTS
jgi:signal transduction histidine kinase/ligand-binding sensor domain-containing protein